MAQRCNVRRISGWVNLDKPTGMSSFKAVSAVRKIFDAAKAGHGGTLDPLATGILPVALGEATKTVSYVIGDQKSYQFSLRWGEDRSTLDEEGMITATSSVLPSKHDIMSVLPKFIGEIDQIPPKFSAIKINGRRAYQLAREDKQFKMSPRRVRIDKLVLLGTTDTGDAILQVNCGGGTYIRSLARDIAMELDTLGYVSSLRRTRVGSFDESTAISLDKLYTLGHSAPPDEYLLPVETLLDDIPAVALTDEEARRIRHGQSIPAADVMLGSLSKGAKRGNVICAMSGGRLVALACLVGGEIRPVRVINFVG